MKKIASIYIIVLMFLLTGCSSITQEEYDLLVQEKQELATQMETTVSENMSLETNNTQLSQEVEKLTTNNSKLEEALAEANLENQDLLEQVDYFENGAEAQIVKIRQCFENENFDEVVTAAEILHEDFNGTPEDIEGQEYLAKSQAALQEIEAAKIAEAERLAAEAQKSAEDKARAIIRVHKLTVSNPNSAGGVDLFIGYTNKSDKVIKYATFTVVPYNQVGDIVSCDIRRNSIFNAQDTGPYEKGQGLAGNYNWYWECAWYNWSIDFVKLTKITIDYMDGSTTTLSGDDVEYVQY